MYGFVHSRPSSVVAPVPKYSPHSHTRRASICMSLHTCRSVFTPYPTVIAKGYQGFEEKGEIDLSILVWFMSFWDLTDLYVSCDRGGREERDREGRGGKSGKRREGWDEKEKGGWGVGKGKESDYFLLQPPP